MTAELVYGILGMQLCIVIVLGLLWNRMGKDHSPEWLARLNMLTEQMERLERSLKDDLYRQREEVSVHVTRMTRINDQRMEKLQEGVRQELRGLREDNGLRLEEMRRTVDEKLHATLERRLGESFKQVSDRLEQVHKGLGEMQTLAVGVGDLKRVLTNVKTRGIWGEIQLGALLTDVLLPQQYEENIPTIPGSSERVEFAIRLPGKEAGQPVWLPIDAKFPQEDYLRLLDAQEQADLTAAEEAGKALENRIVGEAKSIITKYIQPPYTTDFALLFLPVEGLYAEVLRRTGLYERLLRDFKVVVAGPSTLAALLNSLQMGFRTLAVEQRSAEVWTLLGQVKKEFGTFGELLDKTQRKLHEAGSNLERAATKTRTIQRRLKEVQELPETKAETEEEKELQ